MKLPTKVEGKATGLPDDSTLEQKTGDALGWQNTGTSFSMQQSMINAG
jgi:hypothetical protein